MKRMFLIFASYTVKKILMTSKKTLSTGCMTHNVYAMLTLDISPVFANIFLTF